MQYAWIRRGIRCLLTEVYRLKLVGLLITREGLTLRKETKVHNSSTFDRDTDFIN